jgi:hypothetical protein
MVSNSIGECIWMLNMQGFEIDGHDLFQDTRFTSVEGVKKTTKKTSLNTNP